MTETATAHQSDTAFDQLAQRNAELEHDKAALAGQLHAAETRLAAMTRGVRRAREYAGENLPAAAGLTLVTMLENAMKGGE